MNNVFKFIRQTACLDFNGVNEYVHLGCKIEDIEEGNIDIESYKEILINFYEKRAKELIDDDKKEKVEFLLNLFFKSPNEYIDKEVWNMGKFHKKSNEYKLMYVEFLEEVYSLLEEKPSGKKREWIAKKMGYSGRAIDLIKNKKISR